LQITVPVKLTGLMTMRYFVLVISIVFLIPTTSPADETAYRQRLDRHLTVSSQLLPPALLSKHIKLGIVFSIDRDGKLLSADIDQSSGSSEDDAATLAGLKRMQPFPRIPDELQAPYEVKTTFNFGARMDFATVDLRWPYANTITGGQALYMGQIQSHLRDHRLIPSQEQNRHGSLQSTLAFMIDRDGSLLEAVLLKRSGNKAIDTKHSPGSSVFSLFQKSRQSWQRQ
jgi:TonB family protein